MAPLCGKELNMHVKFWGVRGSVPSPLSPEKLEQKMVDLLVSAKGVDTSTPAAVRRFVRSRPVFEGGTVGGNTPCVEVTEGGKRLVIDAGSGLKELGRRLMDEGMAQGGRAGGYFDEPHPLGPRVRIPFLSSGVRTRKQDRYLGVPHAPERQIPQPTP